MKLPSVPSLQRLCARRTFAFRHSAFVAAWCAMTAVAATCSAQVASEATRVSSSWSKTAKVRFDRPAGDSLSATNERLVVSDNGGRTWSVAANQVAANNSWETQLPGDGRYWVSLGTVDEQGRLVAHPGKAPGQLIIVDSTPPRVTLELTEFDDGTVVGKISATDVNLDAKSLRYAAWTETNSGARVPCTAKEVHLSPTEGVIAGQIVWAPKTPGRFVLNASVKDNAQNQVAQSKTLDIADAADRRTTNARPTETIALRLNAPESAAEKPVDQPHSSARRKNPQAVLTASTTDDAETKHPPPHDSENDPTPGNAEELPHPGPELRLVPGTEAPPTQEEPVAADAATAPEVDPTRASVLLRSARNAVALHDIPVALRRFEELLELAPLDNKIRFEYVGLLLQAERYPEARRQLEMLVAAHGEVADYRLALADLLLRLKEFDKGRDQLRTLLGDQRHGRQSAIRIARAYAADHRLAEARQIFEEYLSKPAESTIDDKREMARLLLDMENPAEAVRLLAPLHRADPQDEMVSSLLILGKVRINQRSEALAMIGEVTQQEFKDTGLWLELALELYQEHSYVEAVALLQAICRQDPDYRRAKLGLARAHLRMYEVDEARMILSEFHVALADKSLSSVVIDYHTVVGEYSQAISLAKLRLRDDPQDTEAAIFLGNVYHAMRDFATADCVYSDALQRLPENSLELRRELLYLLATNAYYSLRYDRAVSILEGLLAERPTDMGSRILLISTLIKTRCFDAAEALTRPASDQNPRQRFDLDVQWAYVMLEQGRNGEAANQFELLAANPNGHVPDVAYGLYRAGTCLMQPQMVRQALGLGPSELAPAALWAIGFGDRAMAHCDCRAAGAVLDDALHVSPKNVVLLIHRGEAAQACDCGCANSCHEPFPRIFALFHDDGHACPRADGWFRSALHGSPTNIRARLGLARAMSKHLEYEHASVEYKAALESMPLDVNIIRERARLFEAWRGIERAAGFYVQGEMQLESEHDPEAAAPAPAAGFGANKLVGPPEGEPKSVSPSGLLATEFRAKYLRGWRFQQAIPVYRSLIDAEPTNESALFDLGQSQSVLNRTHCAMETYEELLDVNPCHRDAATALYRNQLEVRPKVSAGFDYQNQQGRDGLANITWQNYTIAERQPLGDENEFIEFGYTQRALQSTTGAPTNLGEIPFIKWQEKFAQDAYLFTDLNVEQYSYGFQTRPTFNTGVNVLTNDGGELKFAGFLQNYYVNGEAIRQDIYMGGVQMNAVVRPLRLWTLSGYYRVGAFSDHNTVNWLNLNSAQVLIQGRRQVRSLINYDFYTFQKQTIFGPNPITLVGTQFPYWSPSGYSFVTAGLEFKEWLSCDTFKAGNQHWYSVFFGAAVDSNADGYFFFNSKWQRDIAARLTWNVETNVIRSQNVIYNAVGVSTNAVLRFP